MPTYHEPLNRARITDGSALFKTQDLYYPPEHLVRAGRLNDDSSPVLYLSFRPQTALAEINVAKEQHVQLSGFKIREKRPLRAAIVGEFYNLEKSGYSLLPEYVQNQIAKSLQNKKQEPLRSMVYMDAFIAELLQDPNARNDGYLRSRSVARLLRENCRTSTRFIIPA